MSPSPVKPGLRFPVTIFLSAFLLFQVQPIIARYVLPWFGGTPAVWSTCLLFFQAALLLGYLYAHWVRRTAVHIGLLILSLGLLPVAPRAEFWKHTEGGDPTLRILLLLAATVGGPYFLLSATAPLLQRWISASSPGNAPWRFYALSNLGSFLALLSYPFLVEPYLTLRMQTKVWSLLYLAFVASCVWTAWNARPDAVPVTISDSYGKRPGRWTILFWLSLSAAGSALLLATTNEVSQEIAVNPFLWVAPLSIYLLTFMLTFESERWYRRPVFAVLGGLSAAAACMVSGAALAVPLLAQLAVYLIALFCTCMICHGELACAKPSPTYLTTFYLTVASGGVLGGVFVALIAPHIFSEYSEFPIAFAAACLLGLAGWMRDGAFELWNGKNFIIRIPLMALLFGGISAGSDALILGGHQAEERWRNFYGILRVSVHRDVNGPFRMLTHGRTTHGFQYLNEEQHDWATSYYGPRSGIAVGLNALQRDNRRIAVIGLGTGTLAAWGRPGDLFRFYEINPNVETIARKEFTFLKDSDAQMEVAIGDGRVQLERESGTFDAIVVDAFAGDTIPAHLLTAEAADIYKTHLAPDGILMLHITNGVLDLDPVARGMAEHLGWKVVLLDSPGSIDTGENAARWVAMAPDASVLERGSMKARASAWPASSAPLIWTDDFTSLWHVLRR
ncbi:MAG TPA: fused MFS/spermidine synthase [Bryobacteraceae bacterium]